MEFIDDHPVVAHKIRFDGRVAIEAPDAELTKDGSVMFWLVRTRCRPPSYHPIEKDSEERFRYNVQTVDQVVALEGRMYETASVFMEHGADQGFIAFGVPSYDGRGMHDPRDDEALVRLEAHVHKFGGCQDGETPADAAVRIIDLLAEMPEPAEVR